MHLPVKYGHTMTVIFECLTSGKNPIHHGKKTGSVLTSPNGGLYKFSLNSAVVRPANIVASSCLAKLAVFV